MRLFDPNAGTKISMYTSSYGLKAVLIQTNGDNDISKPVFYTSRTLTEAECQYAHIEKRHW